MDLTTEQKRILEEFRAAGASTRKLQNKDAVALAISQTAWDSPGVKITSNGRNGAPIVSEWPTRVLADTQALRFKAEKRVEAVPREVGNKWEVWLYSRTSRDALAVMVAKIDAEEAAATSADIAVGLK